MEKGVKSFLGVGGGMRQGAFYTLQGRGWRGVGELARRGPRQDDEGLGGECGMLWGTGAMLYFASCAILHKRTLRRKSGPTR